MSLLNNDDLSGKRTREYAHHCGGCGNYIHSPCDNRERVMAGHHRFCTAMVDRVREREEDQHDDGDGMFMGGDEGEYLGEADDGDHLEGGDEIEGYDHNPELENDGHDAEDVMDKFYDGVEVDDVSDEHSSLDYWNEVDDGDDPGDEEDEGDGEGDPVPDHDEEARR